ncbi:FRE family ferric-chelate reductase [Rhizodiscina lignyota]|uniref:FRE family ferric-chelate reductase n=1 Tax=Rhizodiscina lignyota TaxID=1504668 RepID=A0A9P4IRA7_9PEZI|nr:FRE family ferric-chelate reductase [Rhizodiscina lignyota]
MLLYGVLLLSGFYRISSVNALTKNQECFDTCFEAISYVPFAKDDPDNNYYSTCQYPPKVLSMYAAATKYCTSKEIDAGITLLSQYCDEYGDGIQLLPLKDFQQNLTSAYIQRLPVLDLDKAMATETPYSTPIMLSQSFFDIMYKTVTVGDYEPWTDTTYGFAMYGFWGSILLIGIVGNIVNALSSRSMRQRSKDSESLSSTKARSYDIFSRIRDPINKHLVLPLAFGSHHQRLLYGCTVPTRIVGLVVIAYWSLSLILCAVNYRTFLGNVYYPDMYEQILRYLANRTGVMAFSNLPWLWMFAGRNNIFIWATGWSFSTFNVFHRIVARVAIIEAIVHASCYTAMYMKDDIYTTHYTKAWFTMGVVALVLMCFILLTSTILLRRKAYELFLILHILMAVAVIVSLFYHLSHYDGEYNPYLWPLVAIWGFDRTLRLIRLVYCNIRVKFSQRIFKTTEAMATYNPDSDVITLEVTPGSSMLKPKPGQHFFLYQPFSLKGWENHPFTLGAWRYPGDMEPVTNKSGNVFFDKGIEDSISTTARQLPTEASSTATDSKDNLVTDLHLTFWIRPFDGWTRQLRNKCKSSVEGRSCAKLLIEGPYGESAPLQDFEAVLLIAGGTGVSAINPYLQNHLRQLRSNQSVRTRAMHVVLSARKEAFIDDLCQKELRSALCSEDVHLEFFSTTEGTQSDGTVDVPSIIPTSPVSVDSVDKQYESSSGREVSPMTIHHRRPDIASMILQFARMNDAPGTYERTAVLVCGPAGMADDARSAVLKALKQGLRVDYFEETYGW